MKNLVSIKLQLAMSIAMFFTSIFMTISYYDLVSTGSADTLTTVAFYIWIVSIFAWLIKGIHDARLIKQLNNSQI